MNFRSWYEINYGYFFKQRFLGNTKQLQPSSVVVETFKPDNRTSSTRFITTKVEHNDEGYIQEILQGIDKNADISYNFEIQNGFLIETIEFRVYANTPKYYFKTFLNPLSKQLFLKNIFKHFGVYLSVFIKEHKHKITGNDYILEELKDILSSHSQSITTTCGDYTTIYNKFSDDIQYLGIDATHEGNPLNVLDNRKGITLTVRKDEYRKDGNFTINEDTVKHFSDITDGDVQIISTLLSALTLAGIDFELLYDFTTDYPEVELCRY